MIPHQKKGVTYVDWAISFGLFLITVIFIFILIRPSLERGYEKEDVLEVVQTPFLKYVEWHVGKVPVIIEVFEPQYISGSGPKDTLIEISSTNEYAFEYKLPSPPFTYLSGQLKFKCMLGQGSTCASTPFDIFVYPVNQQPDKTPQLTLKCIPNDPVYCEALLGTTENMYGLNEDAINSFKTLTYEDQRETLGISPTLEFAITVDGEQLTQNNKLPAPQANVFVREIKTWTLNKEGKTTPSVINFKVWQ